MAFKLIVCVLVETCTSDKQERSLKKSFLILDAEHTTETKQIWLNERDEKLPDSDVPRALWAQIWTLKEKRGEGTAQGHREPIHPLTEGLLSERMKPRINRPRGWRGNSERSSAPTFPQWHILTKLQLYIKHIRALLEQLTEWWGLLRSLALVKTLDSWRPWIHILRRLVHWFLWIWWWWGASQCSPP